MINTICFSKDNAVKLKLLLDSIEKNSPRTFRINVLYSFSTNEFKQGYEKLKSENPKLTTHINWVEEESNEFKKQTLELLNTDLTYSCFLTDSDILYRNIEVQENKIDNIFNSNLDLFCFSLRLGTNTKYCHTMSTNNVLVDEKEIDNDFIMWNWSKHYLDFGYPLSINGHIFKTKEIKKLTDRVKFTNSNELEIAWQIFDNFPKEFMASYKTSCLVNSINNLTQNENESDTTLEHINNLYVKEDKIINIDNLDFNNIIGCHQDVTLQPVMIK